MAARLLSRFPIAREFRRSGCAEPQRLANACAEPKPSVDRQSRWPSGGFESGAKRSKPTPSARPKPMGEA